MPPTGVQQKTYYGTARSQARSAMDSVLATDTCGPEIFKGCYWNRPM